MTGPSAIGSENGTPTAMASAPACCTAWSSSSERAMSGCPAVTYTTSALRPCVRSEAKRWERGDNSDEIVADTNAVPLRVVGLDDRPPKRAVLVAIRQVDECPGCQIPHRIADHPHDGTGQHFGQRVHRMDDAQLE